MKNKEYSKNLKAGIVTEHMLAEAIYSYNKRAKNYRDKEADYRYTRRHNRYFYDRYDNEGKCCEKKEEYYRRKDELLHYIKPICIHVVTRQGGKKIYSYQKAFKNIEDEDVIRFGSYYDYERDEEVYFAVVPDPFEEYYLFYKLGDYSFHHPITDPKEYPDLNVNDIGNLETYGREITDLMSVQMADKIRNGLKEGLLHIKFLNNENENN